MERIVITGMGTVNPLGMTRCRNMEELNGRRFRCGADHAIRSFQFDGAYRLRGQEF